VPSFDAPQHEISKNDEMNTATILAAARRSAKKTAPKGRFSDDC
jgi:hypothetical protein